MGDAVGAPLRRYWHSAKAFMEMIKISHSVFALPFAIATAFLAASGLPETVLIGKIILACFFARTAAMAFNRWADRRIDRDNPRTSERALPAGLLRSSTVLAVVVLSSLLFVATAHTINTLAFRLAPVALGVLLGYSYTKRFTQGSHLVLGLALGISPLGAWVAVRGDLASTIPLWLGLAVLFWTAGFDVIYACQDTDIDRRLGLRSIPQRWGIAAALWISRSFHVLAITFLVLSGIAGSLGLFYFTGVAAVAAILVYEQSLVRADDLSRVDVAFFTLNGVVSLAFMATTIAEVLVEV